MTRTKDKYSVVWKQSPHVSQDRNNGDNTPSSDLSDFPIAAAVLWSLLIQKPFFFTKKIASLTVKTCEGKLLTHVCQIGKKRLISLSLLYKTVINRQYIDNIYMTEPSNKVR